MNELEGDIFKSEEYKAFSNAMRGNSRKRSPSSLPNCYMPRDAFDWMNENGWPEESTKCKWKTFSAIVEHVNRHMEEMVLCGEMVELPCRMGTLCAYRITTKTPKLRYGGKFVKLSVDWEKTKRLWFIDPEARKAKKLVTMERTPFRLVHRIGFLYDNSAYYEFIPSRTILNKMRKRMRSGETTLMYELEHIKRKR